MEPALKLEIISHEGLRDGLQPERACSSKSWLCTAHLPADNLVTSHFQQIRNNSGFGGLIFLRLLFSFLVLLLKIYLPVGASCRDTHLETCNWKRTKKATNDIAVSLKSNDSNSS